VATVGANGALEEHRFYWKVALAGVLSQQERRKKEKETYQIEHCAAGDLQVAHMEPPCWARMGFPHRPQDI
jgi:hypothetical protein